MSTPVRSAHITVGVCAVAGMILCYFLSVPVVDKYASKRHLRVGTPAAFRRGMLYLNMANCYAVPYEWCMRHPPLGPVLREYWERWNGPRAVPILP